MVFLNFTRLPLFRNYSFPIVERWKLAERNGSQVIGKFWLESEPLPQYKEMKFLYPGESPPISKEIPRWKTRVWNGKTPVLVPL